MEKLAEQYGSSLRLVVGTVEPNIPGVPFITADRVFSREGIMAIASIVDDWGMDTKQMLSGQEETSGGETISLLAQSLRYIAPHVEQQLAIDCIETMTRQLETGYYRRVCWSASSTAIRSRWSRSTRSSSARTRHGLSACRP